MWKMVTSQQGPLSRVWMSFRKGKKSGSSRTMRRGGQLRIVENEKSAVFGPWILIGAGILIISMPFVQKQYGDAYVSAILAALMFLTGAALCASYGKDKKRNTEEIKSSSYRCLKNGRMDRRKSGLHRPHRTTDPDIYIGWKRREECAAAIIPVPRSIIKRQRNYIVSGFGERTYSGKRTETFHADRRDYTDPDFCDRSDQYTGCAGNSVMRRYCSQ